MIITIHSILHMQSIAFLCTSLAYKNVKISNDQELTQPEPRSHYRNQKWETTKATNKHNKEKFGTLYKQLFL